jgi:tetratricopeptide (TPR) repeat protein
MIMRKLIFILFLLFGAFISNAQPEKLIKEANQLYASNEFAKAIIIYENLAGQGLESPELYFNLGNACYKNQELTKAILYYEKAKLLAPNDEEIQFNLDLVNQFVVDKIEPLPRPFFLKWGQSILNMFTSNGWAFISILTFICMLALAALYIFVRTLSLRKISFSAAIFFLLISLFSFVLAGKQKSKLTHRNHAIIFSTTVTVKSSPDESGTGLFVIHEGLKVEIKEELGNWADIKLEDGNTGWVKKGVFEKI